MNVLQSVWIWIGKTWRGGKSGKAIIGCGGLILVCVVCAVCGQIFSMTPGYQAGATATAQAVALAANATPTEKANPTEMPMPTAISPPTKTAAPSNIPVPTSSQAPTEQPVIAPTATAVKLIVNAPLVIGLDEKQVGEILGIGSDETQMGADRLPELPRGGTITSYYNESYRLDVTFDDKGKSIGVLIDGLGEENYLIDDWGKLLPRVGLNVNVPADVNALASRRWKDVNGYRIKIFSGLDQPIFMIQVWASDAPGAE